ncbi:MAG: hypothetical protein GX660_26095 [Clostridiaceae bacterium]|nr:hypothetical protein [Clostridiaceae bacterium]
MKEKKRDKGISRDPVGDPAFYNDQIGENKEPAKKNIEKKKDCKCKNGL